MKQKNIIKLRTSKDKVIIDNILFYLSRPQSLSINKIVRKKTQICGINRNGNS